MGGCGKANRTWGSPKIVAELAMLGIDVAKSTVEKYRPKRAGQPSPTWRTFLDQHVRDLVSIDFFIVPTAAFRALFVFIVLAHDRRRIVYFNVTEHPTAQWTAQQIVEAFPFDAAPSYLIRDGDGIYGERVTRRIESLGIDDVVTAPASPWQNAYVERVIGTLRRELLDHVIVLNERHLKRLMSSYLDYYHPWRTHQSLDRDALDGRPVRAAEPCNVVEVPAVHGLHHFYLPKAA
ncbi:MAG: integrase core domain-containing protein [Gammaproteobacteria bacterium]|nr:integrase core domain-containing protein [Gammaproteobacteria bacterium]